MNYKIGEKIIVNNKSYEIISLLGHGKGGYSYLAKNNEKLVVLKKIHHEPCNYYSFSNKILSEKNDYLKLLDADINIPKMIDIDIENEIIIKEYIEGKTIFELVRDDIGVINYLPIVLDMAEKAKSKGMNIDFFPTNFIAKDNELYYIDYECNDYHEEWNFNNWGIKYWSKTKEFNDYLKSLKEEEK